MAYYLCDDGVCRRIRTDSRHCYDVDTTGNFESAKMLLEMVRDDPTNAEVNNLLFGVLYYNSHICSRSLCDSPDGKDIRDPIPAIPGILEWDGMKGKVLREKAALILREIKVVQETRYITHAKDLVLHIIAGKRCLSNPSLL